MPNEITSIVFSFIKPEFVTKAVQVYMDAVNNYQEIQGCLGIKLLRKKDNSNEFMLISKWKNISAREKYLSSAFHKEKIAILKKYRQKDPVMNNFEQPPEISLVSREETTN